MREVEEKLNTKFPKILVDYYLKYKYTDIKENYFKVHDLEFSVDFLILLKYANVNFEKVIAWDEGNEYIPNTFIPLAKDTDDMDYYWDASTGKVYYLSIENVEHPIPICDSVEAFFEILNNSCD